MALSQDFESVISLAQLSEFLNGLDRRFAMLSNIKTYGLSISGNTISLVEGGINKSITVPDSDTTYDALTDLEIEAAVDAAFSSN